MRWTKKGREVQKKERKPLMNKSNRPGHEEIDPPSLKSRQRLCDSPSVNSVPRVVQAGRAASKMLLGESRKGGKASASRKEESEERNTGKGG